MAKNVFLVAGCPPPDLTTMLTTATTKVDVRPTEERKGGAHHAPQCALAGSHLGMHPGRSHHGNKNQAAQGRLMAAAPRSDIGPNQPRGTKAGLPSSQIRLQVPRNHGGNSIFLLTSAAKKYSAAPDLQSSFPLKNPAFLGLQNTKIAVSPPLKRRAGWIVQAFDRSSQSNPHFPTKPEFLNQVPHIGRPASKKIPPCPEPFF